MGWDEAGWLGWAGLGWVTVAKVCCELDVMRCDLRRCAVMCSGFRFVVGQLSSTVSTVSTVGA